MRETNEGQAPGQRSSRSTAPRGSSPKSPSPKRLGRYHLRVAGATVVAAGLGVGAVALLSDEEPLPEPALAGPLPDASPLAGLAPALDAPDSAAAPLDAGRAPLEPPPPADRPTLEPPADLPPLATHWRDAVIRNRRQGVLQGARALRDAPDGREQLLALLQDNSGRVRAFALRELGRRRDATLAPVFRSCLSDESSFVVQNARWALKELEREATK